MHQIVNFARDTLGVTLHPGQAAALSEYYESGKQNWLLLAGRRSGKSLLSDVIACYEALIPDFEGMVRKGEDRYILLVSVRQDSAGLHIRNIHKLLKHRKEIGSMIERVAEDRIILSNGCVILSLPASARAARGYTASALVLDEAAFFVDTLGNSSAEAIYTALEPTTATFGDKARIVITTSVGAKTGLVYDLYDRANQGDLDEWYVTKAPTPEMNPAVSEKTIRNALKRDAEGGAAEYLCEFRERTEAFFTSEAVDQCIDKNAKKRGGTGSQYIMAIDPALMKDRYGFGIAHKENGVAIIDYVKALHPPVDANGAEDLIASLVERYKPVAVLCDNASTVQRLRAKIPAMTYKPFTRPMKLKIYGSLKESINLGTVLFPEDDELIDELKALQIRNGVDIAAPKSGRITHDDLADCVALLVDGLISGEFENTSGGVFPNLFDYYAGCDSETDFLYFHTASGARDFSYAPGSNHEPHPPGVTWKNCRYRKNPGCQACIDEQERDPECIEEKKREDDYLKNVDPMTEDQLTQSFIEKLGLKDKYQNQINQEQKKHDVQQLFFKRNK
jgi:hypothetical protein